MPKEDSIIVEGTVTKVLPASLYKVEISVGDGTHELLCHTSGKMKMNSILLTKGDKVKVELSPYDMNKGRIFYRVK